MSEATQSDPGSEEQTETLSADTSQDIPLLMKIDNLLTPVTMNVQAIEGYDKELAVRVVLEPFERGMGHTVGNALRRIILSFMPGSAITEVKIDGVEQEYSNIEGVREDVVDVLLNLKGVNVRLNGAQPAAVLRLRANGAAKKEVQVTAKDFQDNANVEIANPDHPICTLGERGEIYLEATVTTGRGYVPASEAAPDEEPGVVGHLKLDASYSPIERVNYKVESTRVGQRTDLDKLILEIETKGTIGALEIIKRAATILQQQLFAFVDQDLLPAATNIVDTTEVETRKEFYYQIEELDISIRAQNALHSEGIQTIGELVSRHETELLKTPNLGRKSLQEIKDALLLKELHLGMEVPEHIAARD